MRAALVPLAVVACGGQTEVSPAVEPSAPIASAPTPVKTPPEAKPMAAPAPPPAPAPAPPPAKPAKPAPTFVTHITPSGLEEICQLLVAFPYQPADVKADPKSMRWYRKDDFEEIEELCQMSFYAPQTTDTVTAVGVCPKTHWSTPALEMHGIDKAGLEKTEFEKRNCKRDRRYRGAKKIAKFKVRVYDKEPECAMFYFHLSRLLGAAPFIMPATYRSVARTELQKWIKSAVGTLTGGPLPRLNPLQGWSVLQYRHRRGDDLIDGVFSENARGESYNLPFSFYDDRQTRIGSIAEYRNRPYYKLVASKLPLSQQVMFDPKNKKRFDKSLQGLATAQDFTHMMLLDHIFNQRDRSGNINAWIRFHYLDDKGHLRWKKKSAPSDAADNVVALDRLLLKDNDDGLRWDRWGLLNASLLINEINHLDSVTYERLQWLAKLMTDEASKESIKTYFVDSVHINAKTYDEVRARIVDIAARFERKNAAGKLFLDLDLEPVLALRAGKTEETPPTSTAGATTPAKSKGAP